MATNTAGTTAREHPLQFLSYIRKNIDYNTPNIGTDATVEVGVLPAGARIVFTQVFVKTAFNGTGNNIIDVGISGTDDALVDGGTTGEGDGDVDSSATGSTVVYRGGDLDITADTPIYVTYTDSNSDASAGEADIIVFFTQDNDG